MTPSPSWNSTLDGSSLIPASVLTIGNFDGVHLGHQYILRHAVAEATAKGIPSVAMTFDPHPHQVLRPEVPFQLLMDPVQKTHALHNAGVKYCWALPFSRDVSELSPERFLDLIAQSIHPQSIHVGEGFTFGHDRQGNVPLMQLWAQKQNPPVVIHAYPLFQHEGKIISSSHIRDLLQQGKVEDATAVLGQPYSIKGIVVEGQRRGHQMGFPTINLQGLGLWPSNGVYMTGVSSSHWEGMKLGLTNIGLKPTFDQMHRTLETHLPGISGDWYGATVNISFLRRLRDEKKFDGPSALRDQIAEDIKQGQAFWADINR